MSKSTRRQRNASPPPDNKTEISDKPSSGGTDDKKTQCPVSTQIFLRLRGTPQIPEVYEKRNPSRGEIKGTQKTAKTTVHLQ